jgi:hypothetical protein
MAEVMATDGGKKFISILIIFLQGRVLYPVTAEEDQNTQRETTKRGITIKSRTTAIIRQLQKKMMMIKAVLVPTSQTMRPLSSPE